MNEIFKRARLGLLFFGSLLALVIGLLGGGGAELSWAAPVQNPYAQTIPTRIPDETTEPPPAPSPVAPTPTRQQTDNNNNDNQAGETRPATATPPTRETSSPPADVAPTNPPESTAPAQPGQPPAQGSGGEQKGEKPALPPPLKEEGDGQILATPTPSPTPLPAATQAAKAQATSPLNSEAKAGFLPAGRGAWWWVYALVAGVVLLGGGIVLVRRA